MKKFVITVLCILIWSGQVFAVCVGSITASTPTSDFVDNGDGTIIHTKTGLMWKKCPEGQSGVDCTTGVRVFYTWSGALQQAKALNNAGGFATFADWRLPNVKELDSIIERQCYTPSINTTVFPATVADWYWSSSPFAAAPPSVAWYTVTPSDISWAFSFYLSGSVRISRSNNIRPVRLVRGGQ